LLEYVDVAVWSSKEAPPPTVVSWIARDVGRPHQFADEFDSSHREFLSGTDHVADRERDQHTVLELSGNHSLIDIS
jgi:hypothetical protein